MVNSRLSLPDTRLKALMSSSVTLRSARAPTRWTVAISSSTKASVTSRSRSTSNAASRVMVASGALRARVRRCDGDSTAARNHHPASTFGSASANNPAGRRWPGWRWAYGSR